MFVPYSRLTPSVSLYTISSSPFLPVCLASRPPLTIFLPSPSPPAFLSPFSLLSPIPHAYLSYFSHSSGIYPAFLTISQTLSKPEVTKSDKKKRQAAAAGNPSSQEQTTDRKYKEGTGQGKARQYKIPARGAQRQAERQKMAAVRKTAGRQQDLSQLLPAPTTHQRRAVCALPLPPLRGSRKAGYHVNFKNRLR